MNDLKRLAAARERLEKALARTPLARDPAGELAFDPLVFVKRWPWSYTWQVRFLAGGEIAGLAEGDIDPGFPFSAVPEARCPPAGRPGCVAFAWGSLRGEAVLRDGPNAVLIGGAREGLITRGRDLVLADAGGAPWGRLEVPEAVVAGACPVWARFTPEGGAEVPVPLVPFSLDRPAPLFAEGLPPVLASPARTAAFAAAWAFLLGAWRYVESA